MNVCVQSSVLCRRILQYSVQSCCVGRAAIVSHAGDRPAEPAVLQQRACPGVLLNWNLPCSSPG